ncbi:lectin [Nostocales cyanobacterium LEGE 12452]|nr:lectin [Nostocales cyanobacterium LEGE 12452]
MIPIVAGGIIYPGESIYSPNGAVRLTYQTNGDLVVVDGGNFITSISKTGGSEPGIVTLQADGNLVLYNKSYQSLWASSFYCNGSYLKVQDDGNVVIYVPNSNDRGALWDSKGYTAYNRASCN